MMYLEEQDVYLINGDEMRKILHTLWMARALRASTECNQATNGVGKYSPEKWQWVERKCLAKAREFE